jgi:hypothetical protein
VGGSNSDDWAETLVLFTCFHFIGHDSCVLVNPTLEWFNAQLQNDPKFLQKMVKKHFIGEFYSPFKLILSWEINAELLRKNPCLVHVLSASLRVGIRELPCKEIREF